MITLLFQQKNGSSAPSKMHLTSQLGLEPLYTQILVYPRALNRMYFLTKHLIKFRSSSTLAAEASILMKFVFSITIILCHYQRSMESFTDDSVKESSETFQDRFLLRIKDNSKLDSGNLFPSSINIFAPEVI